MAKKETKTFKAGDKVKFFYAKASRWYEGVVVGMTENPDFKGWYCVKITKSTSPLARLEIGIIGVVPPEFMRAL